MQIFTRTSNDVHIVAIAGSLDSTTSPAAQKSLDAVLAGAIESVLNHAHFRAIAIDRQLGEASCRWSYNFPTTTSRRALQLPTDR